MKISDFMREWISSDHPHRTFWNPLTHLNFYISRTPQNLMSWLARHFSKNNNLRKSSWFWSFLGLKIENSPTTKADDLPLTFTDGFAEKIRSPPSKKISGYTPDLPQPWITPNKFKQKESKITTSNWASKHFYGTLICYCW